MKTEKMTNRTYKIVMVLLFAVYVFLLFFKVDKIPLPFNVDEAGTAYDAYSLANYHVDRYLYRFPVYFRNFGGGQNALYTWLLAILIKIFGFNIIIVRLPAIILSLCSALVFCLVVRGEHGNAVSAALMGCFCLQPFSVMHSRWGLESYLLFPMLIFSCSALYHAVRVQKKIFFLFSGILFGITLYAYSAAYLILPIFLSVVWLYLYRHKKIRWDQTALFAVPLVLCAVPLLLMIAVNYGFISEIRTGLFSIPWFPYYRTGEIALRNIKSNLSFTNLNIFYRLFVYDDCAYNVIPKFGSVLYVSIPFLMIGLFRCARKSLSEIKHGRFSFDLMIFALFLSAFFVSLLFERININRACAIFIPLFYFTALGFITVLDRKKTAALVLAGLSVLSFGLFLHYYFTQFPEDVRNDSMFASYSDISEALDFAEEVNIYDDTVYVLDSVQPYIFVLLARQTSPYDFSEKVVFSSDYFVKVYDHYRFRLDAVMPECVYICNTENEIPDEIVAFDFASRQFGTVTVFYPNGTDSTG